MLFRLDPLSQLPLFEQLATSVRTDAAAGRLRSGDRLQAARAVAQRLIIRPRLREWEPAEFKRAIEGQLNGAS